MIDRRILSKSKVDICPEQRVKCTDDSLNTLKEDGNGSAVESKRKHRHVPIPAADLQKWNGSVLYINH